MKMLMHMKMFYRNNGKSGIFKDLIMMLHCFWNKEHFLQIFNISSFLVGRNGEYVLIMLPIFSGSVGRHLCLVFAIFCFH